MSANSSEAEHKEFLDKENHRSGKSTGGGRGGRESYFSVRGVDFPPWALTACRSAGIGPMALGRGV